MIQMISGGLIGLVLLATFAVAADNGFDLSDSAVPSEMIVAGGPAKDGIPALTRPELVSAAEADWLMPDDRVIGVTVKGEARAYPIAILNWHEIINDRIGAQPIVVTYCPLCGTGMVFSASINDQVMEFGVSGLLFQSDVLLYDRASESLWSQIWMEALTGSFKGASLTQIVADHTSWGDWRSRHPSTTVLSRETGYQRDYSRNPYAGYELQRRLYFPVDNRDDSIHPKDWVLGLSYQGQQKAWTFNALAQRPAEFEDRIGDIPIRVSFDRKHQVGRIWHDDTLLPVIPAYWFAWYAFYPESEVVRVGDP